jgi:pimeloyl-ACP methyl ester carboxylesterase
MPDIQLDTWRTRYDLVGQGRTIVLVQGLGLAGSLWGEFAQQLARHHRVLSFDARGAGVAQDDEQPLSTRGMAHDVLALCRQLGIDRAVVLGFSMGGCVAQHLAALAPVLCEGVVLLSTVARPSARSQELLALWRDMVLAGVDPALLLREQLLWAQQADFYDRAGALQEVVDVVRALPTALSPSGFVRQANACIAHDGRAACAQIQTPTQVLVGPQERVFSVPEAHDLAQAIAGARYQCLAQGGHNMWLEHPHMVASAVQDFIAMLADQAYSR